MSYLLNLFVKNKIIKKIPIENHRGELSFKKVYMTVNNKDNIEIL